MPKSDDDVSIRELILNMKAEILEEAKSSNKKTVDSINESINSIKMNVEDNTENIDNLAARVDILERKSRDADIKERDDKKSYRNAVKTDPIEHGKKKVLEEARKIIGLSLVTDVNLEEYIEKGCNKQEALEEAANDFLNGAKVQL